ncbi:MAG: glycoside hydrolase family 5 protein [Planctomycetaceae bacterium]
MFRIFVLAIAVASPSFGQSGKMEFWKQQRRGANGDVRDVSDEWFKAAANSGIEWIRLSHAGIKPADRDPLIGNADKFTVIPPSDLKQLMQALDLAHKHDVRIVLTTFSLPGCRWKQHNDGEFDYRIWHDVAFHEQSADFWKDLARATKDHPAVVGFNVLNEPHPERERGFETLTTDAKKWLGEVRGTAADLSKFNRTMHKAIREVDTETPVMFDGCFHASPEGLACTEPLADRNVLYAFHFYSPWEFTTFRVNRGRFSYPDRMPGKSDGTVQWSKSSLASQFQPVLEWSTRHGIPANQLVLSEFGCGRCVPGAREYLRDTIDLAENRQWHWAFYSFRSSDWDSMDYELGTEKMKWKYWKQREDGVPHNQLVKRRDNPLWQVIRSRFKK